MYRLFTSIFAFIWVYFIINYNGYAQSLYINEIQVANVDQFIDPSYNYGGWVELYNPTSNTISLNGFRLRHTDNEGEVKQQTLSSSHGSVPAGGFAVLWFDHNSSDGYYGPNAGTQIPFKLDADGGKIELINASGSIIDAVEFPQCIARCSWMRETDGASSFAWTSLATPKASNSTSLSASERLEAPIISNTGGVFDGSFHFTVDIPEDCTLYYTTDGSTPESGKSLVSNDGVFDGDLLTIYRFMLSRPGYLNSPVVTRSCFMSDVAYSLPILSVNTAPKNFFDDTIGVKKQFIDAYCIMNGSVFDPERCVPIINAIRNINNQALALEGLSADLKADRLVSRISDEEERRLALKESLKSAFSLVDEYTVSLSSNISNARILLNGQEIPTGKLKGYLFPPITLTTAAPNGYIFEGWNINGENVQADSVLHFSEKFSANEYKIEAICQRTETKKTPILINEISASNDIFVNDYWKKADWIELYNNSDQEYDLAGLYLSDNPDNIHKYQIPHIDSINTIIPAFGHKVIWCDGKDSKTQLHASFKLKNEDGSFISITDASGAWTYSLYYRKQPRWFTFGRYPDGGNNLALFERPTIDNSNRVCTSTKFIGQNNLADSLNAVETDRKIVSIKYYSITGQTIIRPEDGQIVIQQIIYNDGSQKSSKIIY